MAHSDAGLKFRVGELGAVGCTNCTRIATKTRFYDTDSDPARTPLKFVEHALERLEESIVRLRNSAADDYDFRIKDIDKASKSRSQGLQGSEPNGRGVR